MVARIVSYAMMTISALNAALAVKAGDDMRPFSIFAAVVAGLVSVMWMRSV